MSSRRETIKSLGVLSLSTMFFTQVFSSCKSSKMLIANINSGPFNFVHLRDGIGYFKEKGGTVGWSINKDDICVIDTQFPEQAVNLLSEF